MFQTLNQKTHTFHFISLSCSNFATITINIVSLHLHMQLTAGCNNCAHSLWVIKRRCGKSVTEAKADTGENNDEPENYKSRHHFAGCLAVCWELKVVSLQLRSLCFWHFFFVCALFPVRVVEQKTFSLLFHSDLICLNQMCVNNFVCVCVRDSIRSCSSINLSFPETIIVK